MIFLLIGLYIYLLLGITHSRTFFPILKLKIWSRKHLGFICHFSYVKKIMYDISFFQKCNKIFDKRKKLYLHRRLHNKNLMCPVHQCDKKFATKGDLEKHIRTHTGEKPYKCEQCSRRFTQKVSLKSHLETVHADWVLFWNSNSNFTFFLLFRMEWMLLKYFIILF